MAWRQYFLLPLLIGFAVLHAVDVAIIVAVELPEAARFTELAEIDTSWGYVTANAWAGLVFSAGLGLGAAWLAVLAFRGRAATGVAALAGVTVLMVMLCALPWRLAPVDSEMGVTAVAPLAVVLADPGDDSCCPAENFPGWYTRWVQVFWVAQCVACLLAVALGLGRQGSGAVTRA
ncbi:hypothetical protein [Longispora albida]|uniref:hypothetical protein n=1 Tax=Longispora albida TaxID=203523 RepID=UPI0003799B8A|nr:hypothetical protein [Longispora albida]